MLSRPRRRWYFRRMTQPQVNQALSVARDVSFIAFQCNGHTYRLERTDGIAEAPADMQPAPGWIVYNRGHHCGFIHGYDDALENSETAAVLIAAARRRLAKLEAW